MFSRSPGAFVGALALLASASVARAQTIHFGVEPNQNKFEATPAPDMVAGDFIGTYSCGSTSKNVFRVGLAPAPPSIYRHTLGRQLSGFGYFERAEIQGRDAIEDLALPQSVEVLVKSDDNVAQGIEPFVSWYGFGKSEELYVDLGGNSFCRAASFAELQTEEITPFVLDPVPSNSFGGESVLLTASGTSSLLDTEIHLFDAEFTPMYAHGVDLPNAPAWLNMKLSEGRYYIAVADHELATHLPPSVLTFDKGFPWAALDFPGAIVNGSATYPLDIELTVQHGQPGGPQTVTFQKSSPFEVNWFQLDVGSVQSTATFCAGDGSLAPCPSCSSDSAVGAGGGCRNSTGRGGDITFFRGGEFFTNNPYLHLENLPVNAPALVFVSAGTAAPVEVGGGLFCLGSGAIRQPIVSARLDGMALLQLDVFSFPLSLQGQTVYAQAIYRDAGTPCGLNVSSGTSFLLE